MSEEKILDIHNERILAEKRVLEQQKRVFKPRYAGANLGQIRLPLAEQDKLAKFLDKPKNFLIYCGNPGLGKTHFCAALTGWAMNTFQSWRYWDESELYKRLRASMDETKGDYLEALKLLIDDEFIILDDVGSTGLNQWREEVLFDAVDERYNTMMPTLITSNFSVAEFKKLYHPRICSRLFATENTIIEILDGVDLRTQGH